MSLGKFVLYSFFEHVVLK